MKVVTILMILTVCSCCSMANAQDVKVNVETDMANVLDKVVDRVCNGLGEFAGQSGMAMEVAWPHAVKYVGAKRAVYFWAGMVSPVILIIFLPLLIMAIRRANKYETGSWIGLAISSGVMAITGFILTIVWAVEAIIPYYIYQYAPEAATVEYLMQLM